MSEEERMKAYLAKSLKLQNQSDEAFERNMKWEMSFPEHATYTKREKDLMKRAFYLGFLSRALYINKGE